MAPSSDPMENFVDGTRASGDKKNAREQARLEGMHEITLHAMGDKALLAPVDLSKSGLKILDAGCANGRWLKDLARAALPAQHSYHGVDVMDWVFPDPVPENFVFTKHSIAEPFPDAWQATFDIVHQRYCITAAGKIGLVAEVKNISTLLKSVGWLQLVELDSDSEPENPEALKQFLDVIKSINVQTFGEANPFKRLDQAVQEAGLQHVQMRTVLVPWGATASTEEMSAKGIEAGGAALEQIEKSLRSIPGTWKDEWNGLEERFRKELKMQGGHMRVNVIWVQKI